MVIVNSLKGGGYIHNDKKTDISISPQIILHTKQEMELKQENEK